VTPDAVIQCFGERGHGNGDMSCPNDNRAAAGRKASIKMSNRRRPNRPEWWVEASPFQMVLISVFVTRSSNALLLRAMSAAVGKNQQFAPICP